MAKARGNLRNPLYRLTLIAPLGGEWPPGQRVRPQPNSARAFEARRQQQQQQQDMSRPSTPSSKAATTRSHREDVLQFLDNLDSFDGVDPTAAKLGAASSAGGGSSSSNAGAAAATAGSRAGASKASANKADDPQAVLDFLDEIVTSRDRRTPTTTGATTTSSAAASGGGVTGSAKKSALSNNAAAGAAGIPRSGSRGTLRDSTSSSTGTRGSYLTPRDTPTPTPASASGSAAITPNPSSGGATAVGTSPAAQAAEKLEAVPPPAASSSQSGSGWGWGSVWSQASSIVQQARNVAEEQVAKNLPASLPSLPVSPSTASAQGAAALSSASDQARQWRSGALSFLSSNLSNLDIDKLRKDITETGIKALKDVMDAVAPPIAQHEVIQVNLSHDMIGYEGVETLVYRALAKIMEQVPGGDLVVNKGSTDDMPSTERGPRSSTGSRPEDLLENEDEDERNLNTVDGFNEAFKLAEANLDAMLKRNASKAASETSTGDQSTSSSSSSSAAGHARKASMSVTVPVTICPVYMRIQPVLAQLPFASTSSAADAANPPASSSATPGNNNTSQHDDRYLFFILLLRDPNNGLYHKTITQSIPRAWLDIPFEENEWVEDIMVDIIRRGVEIIGEEYVKGRMSGRLLRGVPAAGAGTGGSTGKEEILFEEKDSEGSERDSIEVVNASAAGVPS